MSALTNPLILLLAGAKMYRSGKDQEAAQAKALAEETAAGQVREWVQDSDTNMVRIRTENDDLDSGNLRVVARQIGSEGEVKEVSPNTTSKQLWQLGPDYGYASGTRESLMENFGMDMPSWQGMKTKRVVGIRDITGEDIEDTHYTGFTLKDAQAPDRSLATAILKSNNTRVHGPNVPALIKKYGENNLTEIGTTIRSADFAAGVASAYNVDINTIPTKKVELRQTETPPQRSVFTGIADGSRVYGISRQDVLNQGAKAETVGQTKITDKQVRALGLDPEALSTTKIEIPKAEKPEDPIVGAFYAPLASNPSQIVYGITEDDVRQRGGDMTKIKGTTVRASVLSGFNIDASNLPSSKPTVTTPGVEKDPETVVIYMGENKDGKMVFGVTKQDVKRKGAVEGTIGQVTKTKDFALGLGYDETQLSKTAFQPVAAEPAAKGKFEQYVKAYPLNDQDQRAGKITDVPLALFDQNRTRYEPLINPDNQQIVAFQRDPDTEKETPINVGYVEAAKAIDKVNSFFNQKYVNNAGEEVDFVIEGNATNKDSNVQLGLMRNFVRELPKQPNGAADFSQFSNQQIFDMVRYTTNLIQESAVITDPDTKERIRDEDFLIDQVSFFNTRFQTLNAMPGLRESLEIAAGLEQHNIMEAIKQRHTQTVNGESGVALVAQIPAEVPAEMVPGGSPGDPPVLGYVTEFSVLSKANWGDTINAASAVLAGPAPQGETESGRIARLNVGRQKLLSVVEYKRDSAGRILKGPGGQNILEERQPGLAFLRELNTTTAGTSHYDVFANLLKPSKMQTSMNVSAEAAVKSGFAAFAEENYAASQKLMRAFLPINLGDAQDRILYKQLTGKSMKGYRKYREAELVRADGAVTGARQLEGSMSTYFVDGEFLNINTFWGNMYVRFDGAVNMLSRVPVIGELFKGEVQVSDVAQQMTNTLYSREHGYMSASDVLPDEATLKEMATSRGFATVDAFLTAEKKAKEENRAAFADAIKGIDSNDNKIRNLALRNYYRYMVAYTMAAAIQGGTGGRTISDQDVQNILRALSVESPFIEAKVEYQILAAAREMLLEIERHSRAISKGGDEAYMAMKTQEFRGASGVNLYTVQDVVDRLSDFQTEGDRKDTGDAGFEDYSSPEAFEALKERYLKDDGSPVDFSPFGTFEGMNSVQDLIDGGVLTLDEMPMYLGQGQTS